LRLLCWSSGISLSLKNTFPEFMSFSRSAMKGKRILSALSLLLCCISIVHPGKSQPATTGKTKIIRETSPRGWIVSLSSGVFALQADPQGNVYCLKTASSNNKQISLLLRYVNDSIWADATPGTITEDLKDLRVTEKG
jgi:hypothetical protein